MKRRDALSTIGTVGAGSLVLPSLILTGCDPGPYAYSLFDWGDTEILDALAEVIIPATPGVPGAAAAGVGEFIQLMVSDTLEPDHQRIFLDGYANFKVALDSEYRDSFDELDTDIQVTVVEQLEGELEKHGNSGSPDPHFYGILKHFVVFGYFSSEIGATQALRYVPVPGEQKGVVPYNGEKAWAL